ncbi:CHC2 zinc finger domain-containing protein [Streptomyces africanus]|uniref:CHC2 zinc finger domain-containing protein n=1 Tax=Streptomyces africanus TaxID=231024 RepID=UPI003520FB9B
MGAYGSSVRREAPAQFPIAPVLAYYGVDPKEARWGHSTIRCVLPDHDDRTPSLSIDLEKGVFHCFGCQRGGAAVQFIMFMDEKAKTREAAERRAEEILRAGGIDVPSRSRGRYRRPGLPDDERSQPRRSRYVPPGHRT